MTNYFLSKVMIEGFRGINNEGDPLSLKFDNECVNSVFAPNGSGKSSIYEALYYAMRDQVPRLDELPSSDQSSEYYCNRFHSSGATITLVFKTDQPNDSEFIFEIKRTKEGLRTISSPSGYPDVQGFLNSLENNFSFLDYRTFSRFVEDSPLKRGRAFSALLGLSKISELRQVLAVLSNSGNLKRDFEIDRLETKIRENERTLFTTEQRIRSEYIKLTQCDLNGEIKPEEILYQVKIVLSTEKLIKPLLNEQIDLTDFNRLRSIIRDEENSKAREELSKIISSLSNLEALAPKDLEHDDIEAFFRIINEYESLLQKTFGPILHKILIDAEDLLTDSSWDQFLCPICDSSLTQPLSTHIHKKLQPYEEVKNLRNRVKVHWQSALWVSRLRSLENAIINNDERKFSDLDYLFTNGQPTSKALENVVARLECLESSRTNVINDLLDRKKIIIDSLPPSLVQLMERVEASEQLVKAVNEYKHQSEELSIAQDRLYSRIRWRTFISNAHSAFAGAEVKLSTEKTLEIENEYREMYKTITANSEIVPKLEKAPGSEELRLRLEKFYNQTDLSAITLLSESYRNALAISLYLCAALRSKTKARFLVLDDITSSFDAGHQFSLMELIRTKVSRSASNPDGLQVILLSHDGLLEKYFDRVSQDAEWKHQSLHGKSPQGKLFTQSQEAERLKTEAKNFLSNGQINQAEPLVRQYLEYRLLSLIKKLEINVPLDFAIRGDQKMVSNCINAIKSSVDLYEKAGLLIMEASQVVDFRGKIVAPAIIANMLAHYDSAVASGFDCTALINVLDEIDSLANCFKYNCHCRPGGSVSRRYYKNLTKRDCACK